MIWKTAVGSATLYGIQDGRSDRDPLKYLVGSTREALADYPEYLNADGTMPNSFSCYLFDTGTHRIMIDTGFGAHAPEGIDAGHMPGALDGLDWAPQEIDHVVFTHLHPDHILGSLDEAEEPFFVNATHWTTRSEVTHWRSGTDERSQMISQVVNTLDDAGVLNSVEDPGDVVAGVRTIATYGHTPGHVAVRVASGDDAVVIAGDVTFSPMQIDHPDWAFPMDVDPEAAATTREQFFADRADDGVPFAAGHYNWPGYGRVVLSSRGVEYQPLRVESS